MQAYLRKEDAKFCETRLAKTGSFVHCVNKNHGILIRLFTAGNYVP